jgi:lactoylglutathione lyase
MLSPKIVGFIVKNVASTVEFYEKAFGLKLHYLHPSAGYAELASGSTVIAFMSEEFVEKTQLLGDLQYHRNHRSSPALGAHVAFWSDAIESDWEAAVEAGASVVSPLQPKPWGQITGYLRDLDGIVVELCTPSPRTMPS